MRIVARCDASHYNITHWQSLVRADGVGVACRDSLTV